MKIQWKNAKVEQDVIMLINLLEKGSFTTEEANVQKMLVDSISREQGVIGDYQLLCFFCKAYDNFILSVADKIDLHDKEDYVLAEKVFEFGNKAIELSPSNGPELLPLSFVYEAFATVYFILDEFEKAIEYSSKVLSIRPNHKKSAALIESVKNLRAGSVSDQIRSLQGEFEKIGLRLYLQGGGEAPSSSEMDRFTVNPPIKFPVGSAEIIAKLKETLMNKQSVMLMKTGKNWELFIKSGKKEKTGCFIATAVFDTPYALEVKILRDFRDRTLLNYSLGRVFIRAYYSFSPLIATVISKNEKLKSISKKCLFNPIISIIAKPTNGE